MSSEAVFPGAGAARPAWTERAGTARLLDAARGIARGAVLAALFAWAGLDYLISTPGRRPIDRARWLHRWSRRVARVLGMTIEQRGGVPRIGLIVANHLSYVDIVALSATAPCLFLAKREVAGWPVLGAFARMAGTLFIDRSRRSDVARAVAELKTALSAGLPVVIFPEGTSTDGREVLPFKSSLFQAACDAGAPVTAAAIDYSIDEASAEETVCYWGDMTLLPHMLRLLAACPMHARLAFGRSSRRAGCRKRLAGELRREVVALRGAPVFFTSCASICR